MEEVEDVEVRREVDRCRAVGELTEKMVDARLSTKRKRNVDEIDLARACRLDEIRKRADALAQGCGDRMASLVVAVVIKTMHLQSERGHLLDLKRELFSELRHPDDRGRAPAVSP